jgi:hypothetical protein
MYGADLAVSGLLVYMWSTIITNLEYFNESTSCI